MTIKIWTKKEIAGAIELRLRGMPWAEIASRLNRSESSLWVKFSKLGFKLRAGGRDEEAVREYLVELRQRLLAEMEVEDESTPNDDFIPPAPAKTMADTTVEEDLEEMRHRVAMANAKASMKKYEAVLNNQVLEDRLVDVFRERIGPFAPPPPVAPPSFQVLSKIGLQAESAVLVLSDLHFGQRVSKSQTNFEGSYCPRVACERLHYMQEKVIEVLASTPAGCDELVVLLLGDIVHGAIDHGAEREDHAVVADQFQLAVWSLHQFLANLALRVPSIRIYTVVGNHGRLPNQKRMPTINRFSNLDHLVYCSLQLTLALQGLSNVTVHINDSPRQFVDIKGSRFVCQHGDVIRGGDKQFGVPVHSLTRDVNATLQRAAANDEPGADYFIMGDKHKSISLPLGRGEYIVNGSMVGADEFSMSFCPAEPMQLLFGVDRKLRKTWTYPIKVAHAPSLPSCPYLLPPQIRHLVEDPINGSHAA